jgi:hypothetical protein
MNKLGKFTIVALFILILGFTAWRVSDSMKFLEEKNETLLLRVSALEKGMPDMARYFKVVHALDAASKGKLKAAEVVDVARVIMESCILYKDMGLSEDIIFGLIERESGFNPKALSDMKAYGLTQCIRMTFELHLPSLGYQKFTEDLAFNPVVNMRVGVAEIVRLRKIFLEDGIDSWHIVLSAYYYGERPVWSLLKTKASERVTLEYGKGVMDLAKKWKERGL